MEIKLIRNATLRVTYAGHTFLIDPYFAPKHSLPSFTGRSPNPMVDLPEQPSDIIKDCEMIIVSHLHTDHFDSLAQEMLPKELPIFCQPGDEGTISEKGFTQVTPITDQIVWQNISITRTTGRHGTTAPILQMMGHVSGFVLAAEGEPMVYWMGDTVWYEDVQQVIDQHEPDIIITHSGGAVWGNGELIIMDAAQTIALCKYAPHSEVVATHIEALDHCLSTRSDLKKASLEAGILEGQLFIPEDGMTIEFKKGNLSGTSK